MPSANSRSSRRAVASSSSSAAIASRSVAAVVRASASSAPTVSSRRSAPWRILLEPAALRVSGLDDAPARRFEPFARARASAYKRGLATAIRRRRNGVEQCPVGDESLVVDEHGDLFVAILDRSDHSAGAARRQLELTTGLVDEALASGQAIPDDE